MSHEEEVTTGPFDETDEHDYGDHHHHHDDNDGNGWNNQSDKQDGGDVKSEEPSKRNLYVSNLSFETTEEMLRERFSPFGEIVSIEIVREPTTKQSRGFGFITFAHNEEGENAVNNLNGTDINGRALRVEHARRSTGHAKTPGRYLGPKGSSSRFNDKYDRRGGDRRSYNDYHHSGPPRGRRSSSRERRPDAMYRGGRSRSRDRGYDRDHWGGGRYPDSRGPPPPSDRWGGPPPGRRSRSRDRSGPPRPAYGGYDSRRDRR